MDGTDTLLTTAEVAIALAGFSGIVVVLGRPSLSDWTPADVLRLQSLLGVSLGAAIFALLPLALHHAGLVHTLVVALSSASMAAYVSIMAFLFMRAVRGMSAEFRQMLNPGLTGVLSAVWAVVFTVLLLNAIGVVLHREFGAYYLCLLWFLIVSVVQFARIILVRFRVQG